jgi:hypothetical protein
MKEDVDSSHSQIEVLEKEKAAAVALSKDLQRQNNRLEWLQSYIEKKGVRAHNSAREQHEGVLMHYNELQLRSGMNFQKRVAGAVAKAGFRQKPGPKKKARKSGGAEPMAIDSMPHVRGTPCFWSRWRRKSNFSKGGAEEADKSRER